MLAAQPGRSQGRPRTRRARSPSVTGGLPYTRSPGTAPGPGEAILPPPPDGSDPTVSYPDNGSAFTARAFKTVLSGLEIAHRRGGYRDPESQAFIESWFGKLKERCVWREEFDTLDHARQAIGDYVTNYHHRPHSRLNYNTPLEVAATWRDGQDHLPQRPKASTRAGSTSDSLAILAERHRDVPLGREFAGRGVQAGVVGPAEVFDDGQLASEARSNWASWTNSAFSCRRSSRPVALS